MPLATDNFENRNLAQMYPVAKLDKSHLSRIPMNLPQW